MTRTVVLTVSMALAVLLACVATLVIAAMKPAEAAFPGRNGAIAYVSERTDSTGWPFSYVYRGNPDGTGVKRLADVGEVSGEIVSPTWSADGKKIAFSIGHDIFLMNANGTREINLTNDPEVRNYWPAFYPSGRKIVSSSSQPGGSELDLYSLSFDAAGMATGPPTRLTTPGNEREPAVSPDGKKVAFISSRGFTIDDAGNYNWGNYFEIYVMRADTPEGEGNQPVKLTNDTGAGFMNADPNWSPDGKKIAFTKDYGGNSDPDNLADIIVMNADGSGKNLTEDGPGYHAEPAFSPDGKWIAFASDRDGDWEIWKMRADGSSATQVTKNARYQDNNPDWQLRPPFR
jgi:TolB protein